jgi:hypothetical protein
MENDMEQFTRSRNRTSEHRKASPQTNDRPAGRAPLYASPWLALFVLLRNEYRLLRAVES